MLTAELDIDSAPPLATPLLPMAYECPDPPATPPQSEAIAPAL